MRDFLTNHYLSVKNFLMRSMNIKPKVKRNGIVRVYMPFDLSSFSYVKEHYTFNPDWGLYDKNNTKQWFDKNSVSVTKWGLELDVNERLFKYDFNSYITTGIGMVVSKEHYSYGLFEWNVLLPVGMQLWPAVWLSSADSWPPEIDVLEAYSDNKGLYKNKLNSNVYIGQTPNHSSIGAMSHGILIDTEKSINLKLDWQADYIKIYYNNFLVRKITDKSVLRWFEGKKMKVIMNNAVREENVSEYSRSPFIIQDFTYYKTK